MPSAQKVLYFLSSALATSVSVGILGYAMSAQWAEVTIACTRAESDVVNGSALITLQLFAGEVSRQACPNFGSSDRFPVIPQLLGKGAPVVLHTLVVLLLALSLMFSAISILISLYNSVSNPYETYLGPTGVYTCSSFSACLSVLILIVFVANVNLTDMAEGLVKDFTNDIPVDLLDKSAKMQLGYYLVIPYTVLSLVSIGMIYMYDHAAYTHRREQQRPTEDAPKEIMMY